MAGLVKYLKLRVTESPMYLLVLREREECSPVSVMTEAGLEQGQGRLPLLELSPAPPVCSITLPCSMIT